jgi:hypothetical protein
MFERDDSISQLQHFGLCNGVPGNLPRLVSGRAYSLKLLTLLILIFPERKNVYVSG